MRRRDGAERWTCARARRIGGLAVAPILGLALLLHPSAATAQALAGDGNCDGVVDNADLGAVTVALFAGSGCATADVNGDGELNAADLVALERILATLPTPTATASGSPTSTGMATPSFTATRSATATGSVVVQSTPTSTATRTASRTPTPSAVLTHTATPL